MTKPANIVRTFIAIGILFTLLLAGCNAAPQVQPTANLLPSPTAAPTQPPTATPLPEKVVLVGEHESNFPAAQALLEELSAQDHLLLEIRPTLEPGEITPEWKIVVLLSRPDNLSDLLAAAPQTQFVLISAHDIEAGGNLSTIRARRELEAFAAGYLSALVGYDWRTAGLLPSDTPLGEALGDAFRNGQLYFCGMCNTYYAPYTNFPLVKQLPSDSSPAAWQAALQEMALSYIYALYVAPEAASPELYSYIVTLNAPILGSKIPPEEIRPLYAASIYSDDVSALSDLWPDLLAGQGGKNVNADIKIGDVNPQLLSPGRLHHAEAMIQDLTDGWINPFTPPLE